MKFSKIFIQIYKLIIKLIQINHKFNSYSVKCILICQQLIRRTRRRLFHLSQHSLRHQRHRQFCLQTQRNSHQRRVTTMAEFIMGRMGHGQSLLAVAVGVKMARQRRHIQRYTMGVKAGNLDILHIIGSTNST